MDRRLHDRVTVQFEAKVTKLNNQDSVLGTVSDLSKAGINVAIPMKLTPGDLVEVEMADSILSGCVVYSNPDGTLFRTGIEVDQIRLGTTDLSHLLQRTLSEAMPGVRGLDHSETYIG
jgi:hypothetical protein